LKQTTNYSDFLQDNAYSNRKKRSELHVLLYTHLRRSTAITVDCNYPHVLNHMSYLTLYLLIRYTHEFSYPFT